MSQAGKDYALSVQPDPLTANRFTAIKWFISNTEYGTIDPASGVVHVTKTGEEANNPSATVTCEITTDTGEIVKATQVIGFYTRSCKVGDIVFCDGTYSDVLAGGKTPVGVCFWINPEDKTQRLCMALSNLPSVPWGLYREASNGNNGFDSLTLEDRPAYNCFDILTIQNITSRGLTTDYITEETYRDETSTGDPDGYKYLTGAVGSIGFTEAPEAIGGYDRGTPIPIGLLNTLRIIAHRDLILNDPTMDELPKPGDDGAGLYQSLINCINTANAIAPKYRQFYYPAASLCNAYEPGVKAGETLADCFKQGKWFLPAEGDLARMYWLHHFGYTYLEDGEKAPLQNAAAAGVFTAFSSANYWSSAEGSEYGAWNVSFSNGSTWYNNKYNGYAVRAVAAF